MREGLRVRKLAGADGTLYADHLTGEPSKYPLAGVAFLDLKYRQTDEAPTQIRLATDYVTREPWIELVGVTAVAKPGGPASNPYAKVHQFLHADELVLHMVSGDYRYKVVHQPDKYGADGKPTDKAGDPTAEVHWYYDADLIEE